MRWGESDEQAVCLWHRSGRSLLELSGYSKPSIICGVETGAVLRIRHKSLTEQIRAAAQCPWGKKGDDGGRTGFVCGFEAILDLK